MASRITGGGNGSAGKGMIDACPVYEGCTTFIPNPTHPPTDKDLPFAITEVFQKFMLGNPIKVRHTLPIVSQGNTVALFVWWDRVS